jgi:hypothetical protein
MYSVHQHWDPLKKCIVGKTYPPEFYSFIEDPKTRNIFEKLSEETEEDYQNLISLLKNKFNVDTFRPEFPSDLNELFIDGKWVQPPTAPRDYFLMIGENFWVPEIPNSSHAWNLFYKNKKHIDWPWFDREVDFINSMSKSLVDPFIEEFKKFQIFDQKHLDAKLNFYTHIFDDIKNQGNEIVYTDLDFVNGCFVSRLGENLIFATQTYYDNKAEILEKVNDRFPEYSNKVVKLEGHGDSVYCPVTPGLIISLSEVDTYKETFPDWEVVYLPDSEFENTKKFEASMRKNKGRWFLPNFEKVPGLVETVDYYFNDWLGQVSETVFDLNILVVDPKNIIVSSYNDQVADACNRYGIEMHVSPFRHRYFWDAGIHCVTNDLNRVGKKQKFL